MYPLTLMEIQMQILWETIIFARQNDVKFQLVYIGREKVMGLLMSMVLSL